MIQSIILHSDMNNFYASVECLDNPQLIGKPVAVAGDREARHGIVLAKNYEAKKYGVTTGEPLWVAKQKCPGIIFTPPRYDRYIEVSQAAREIYESYTDKVESFGLDECWLDVTESTQLFGEGKEIADEIRNRIKNEIGVTASVGVSFNKVFAKLGSDLKKPDATNIIGEDFRTKIWHLPADMLLYVGKATYAKLIKYSIYTIGDLACTDPNFLKRLLGKNGTMLWAFANGYDRSPVLHTYSNRIIKSIGNSTTAPRDLVNDTDIKIILYILSESVAERMRKENLYCRTIQLSVRDNKLESYQRQGRLNIPSCTAQAIYEESFRLYCNNRPPNPVRSLGVRACNLVYTEYLQLSFLEEVAKDQRQEELERCIDKIRQQYGHYSIQRGIMLMEPQLSHLDPIAEHTIYPESFIKKIEKN